MQYMYSHPGVDIYIYNMEKLKKRSLNCVYISISRILSTSGNV